MGTLTARLSITIRRAFNTTAALPVDLTAARKESYRVYPGLLLSLFSHFALVHPGPLGDRSFVARRENLYPSLLFSTFCAHFSTVLLSLCTRLCPSSEPATRKPPVPP